MNRKQTFDMGMMVTTEALCESNIAVVNTIPAFATSYKSMKAKLAAARTLAKHQETVTKGITEDKAKAKVQLADQAFTLASVIQAYATATSNNHLLGEVKFSRSTLVGFSDQRLVQVADVIKDRAQSNIKALKEYGVLPATLTAYTTQLDQFKALIPATTIANNQREAYTESLELAIKEANAILRTQMDKTAKMFQTTNPEFYRLYKSARKVRQTGARKDIAASVKGTVSGVEGALENTIVEVVDQELVVSTSVDGSYSFEQLTPGTYTLRFIRPTYKTTEITVILGNKADLVKDVTMVKA